ncbi:hypothetical protein BC940DRAFT_309941 [Gongronella butleri]|nr:hypothetical protein BC940DRAFT_309941 [Gongronella butleri]
MEGASLATKTLFFLTFFYFLLLRPSIMSHPYDGSVGMNHSARPRPLAAFIKASRTTSVVFELDGSSGRDSGLDQTFGPFPDHVLQARVPSTSALDEDIVRLKAMIRERELRVASPSLPHLHVPPLLSPASNNIVVDSDSNSEDEMMVLELEKEIDTLEQQMSNLNKEIGVHSREIDEKMRLQHVAQQEAEALMMQIKQVERQQNNHEVAPPPPPPPPPPSPPSLDTLPRSPSPPPPPPPPPESEDSDGSYVDTKQIAKMKRAMADQASKAAAKRRRADRLAAKAAKRRAENMAQVSATPMPSDAFVASSTTSQAPLVAASAASATPATSSVRSTALPDNAMATSKPESTIPALDAVANAPPSHERARPAPPMAVPGRAPPSSAPQAHASPAERQPLPNFMRLHAYTSDICKMVYLRIIGTTATPAQTNQNTELRPRPRVHYVHNVYGISVRTKEIQFAPQDPSSLAVQGTQDDDNGANPMDAVEFSAVCYLIRFGVRDFHHLRHPLKGMLETLVASLDRHTDFVTFVAHWNANPLMPVPASLRTTIQQALTQVGDMLQFAPQYELLWVLYVELTSYSLRQTPQFIEKAQEALAHCPGSIDIRWFIIQLTRNLVNRERLIQDALSELNVYARNKAVSLDAAAYISHNTAELLLRCLALDGAYATMKLLTRENQTEALFGRREVALTTSVLEVHLNGRAESVFLLDDDLFYVWMSLLYTILCDHAPRASMRGPWYERMGLDGARDARGFRVFLIDWSILDEYPLNPQEQRAIVSILFAMVQQFTARARLDASKRHLVTMAWQSLWEALAHLPCYGPVSTLVLLQQHGAPDQTLALQPEMYSEMVNLQAHAPEMRLSNDDPIWRNVQRDLMTKRTSAMPRNHALATSFFLGLRAALVALNHPNTRLPADTSPQDTEYKKRMMIGWRLGRPLWLLVNNATLAKLDRMRDLPDKDMSPNLATEHLMYLCGLYDAVLDTDNTFSVLIQDRDAAVHARTLPFAWMNMILIHYLHFLARPDSPDTKQKYETAIYHAAKLGVAHCTSEPARDILGAFIASLPPLPTTPPPSLPLRPARNIITFDE